MTTNSAYDKLDALGKRLEALDHAQSMLFVDEAVNMPAGGGEKRAEAMSVLAGMQHEMATAPEIGCESKVERAARKNARRQRDR